MSNPFRDNAALDGFEVGSVFKNPPSTLKKRKSQAKIFAGDIYPKLIESKKRRKLKEEKEEKKKEQKYYESSNIYIRAFDKLDKQVIIVDGKKHKCMDLFFEKCLDGYIIHANEIVHWDPSRALVERWITKILADVKVNYEITLNLKPPTVEKELEAESEAKEIQTEKKTEIKKV